MASSIETGGRGAPWKMFSCLSLGSKIPGSTRTEMTLSSRWKILNKELAKWRGALAKARDNHRSRENLSNKLIHAQIWFGAIGQGKKPFNHHECWEVVKNCKRFRIIPTGPPVMLNETPLHDSTTSDSPRDSPMSQDSLIEKEPRPIGRKAAKAKKWSNSSTNTSKNLEEIARLAAIRIEMEKKHQENEMTIRAEYLQERDYLRKQHIEKTDQETMAMDTSHMSPETKQFWKLEQRDAMRRRLFRDDGPSNTYWLNDQNH
ncbi:unnamed protein product [Prunus armeniaca]